MTQPNISDWQKAAQIVLKFKQSGHLPQLHYITLQWWDARCFACSEKVWVLSFFRDLTCSSNPVSPHPPLGILNDSLNTVHALVFYPHLCYKCPWNINDAWQLVHYEFNPISLPLPSIIFLHSLAPSAVEGVFIFQAPPDDAEVTTSYDALVVEQWTVIDVSLSNRSYYQIF